ncbi:hypothetical protein PVL29_027333 [Vitis rotundifolia]|uniref:ADP-ribosyl cyclase/cyclic ADP-ribose hydrolase n=1 Tax=Vitis rotundifolia TaxID=103349 RepID=A0AA38YIZ0_VITRO|nr:hypothetical protein PVL29_027333 [Vitis rotundifolia]
MTSTNTQIISYSPPPPSSSSKSTHQFAYEVFLSFRGEDTRYGFTDHLYEALISHGICTFRDDEELVRGRVIASELLNAIEESKIFVIIFSKNYATSRWCLDELVKIFACMATKQRLILPIFYHVDPSEVRKQSGCYEEAFRHHEKEADVEKKKKIQKWRIALTEAGNLAGYDLQNYRYETRLIKEIIDVILKELNFKLLLHVSENMVGMNVQLEKLKSLIKMESNDDVRMIGIYGLGGIGKTTISKVVYNNIFHLFESSIFIANVRERSQSHSSQLELQKELLNGIIRGKNLEINNIHEVINVIKQRLCSKKVLLILDDVDKLEQLELLAGKRGWFDQLLLRVHDVDVLCEVKELDYKESIQLFCQHAFKQNIPEKDYVSVSNDVVHYANGLPLAIEILGSSLFSKSKDEWESTLQKLKKIPNMQVQNVLSISLDGLDKIERGIFLDVACFFNGCKKNDVTTLLDYAIGVIRVLSDKCLITLSHNIIRMHDLVQEMGREIVRHDHPQKPWKWSRLWDPEDICRILRQKKGPKAIEGIFLDMSRSREISFTTKAFERMERLRLLKVYWSCDVNVNDMGKEYQKLILPEDFEFPSYDLRYLHWEGYSLKSLPSNFEGENLIELNLEHSNIKHLWQREKCLQKLKVLNLSSSQQLTDMPRFSNMSNLEKLNIQFCGSLDNVDSSIGFLTKLTLLNLSGCRKIRSLPNTIHRLVSLESLYLDGTAIQELPFSIQHLTLLVLLSIRNCKNLRSLSSSICKLKSLKYLYLSGCSNLKTFPEITKDMKCLKALDLSGTCIKEAPLSIEYLNHLTSLRLADCRNLGSLPSSIGRLKSLEKLYLYGCSNLETFPEITKDMKCLKALDLSGTCIKELPSSIEYLNHLTSLRMVECKSLRSLPSNIYRLKSLKSIFLRRCSNLESFPEIMEDMECLKELDLSKKCVKELPSSIEFQNCFTLLSLVECENLRSLPSNICRLKSLKYLFLRGCSNLETFPEIKEEMECLEKLDLSGTCIKELPSSIEYLNHLTSLRLVECKSLRSLPSNICRLKSLKSLSLKGCPNLETFPEIMEDIQCLKELDLSKKYVKELPSSIEFQNHLTSLLLVECENLRSLPNSICRLKSLKYLFLRGSNLETFPEIMEYMECLEKLDLSGTCIKELPSSIEYLNHLTSLSLVGCKNLKSLPGSICRLKSLKSLSLRGCSNLETFPEIMEDMKCLKYLDLSGASIKKLPSSIGYLNHLSSLCLSHCKNLRSLPSSIGRLTLLTELYLNGCPNLVKEDMENLINLGFSETQNLMDEVTPSDLWCLSSLVKLDLSQNDMRHIPAAITQLCKLEHLNISHCNMLEEIPELPPSLKINAHDCPTSNGIPGWVLHQEMGSQIRIELPMNWYEDDDFLGFAFSFFIFFPYVTAMRLMVVRMKCGLYCPKTAIRDKFHSDQYMHLEASFDIFTFVHLIFSQDHQQNHISLLNFPENSGDSRSITKDIKRSHDDAAHNQAEEPYHKRLRESNTHLKLLNSITRYTKTFFIFNYLYL